MLDAQLSAATGDRERATRQYEAALSAAEPAQALSTAPMLAALADLQIESNLLDAAEVTLARAHQEPKASTDPMLAASLALSRAALARRRG